MKIEGIRADWNFEVQINVVAQVYMVADIEGGT